MDAPASEYERDIAGLSPATRALLADGAEYWSDEGPARPDEELLVLMGLHDLEAARHQFGELSRRLRVGEPVSALDLTRVLLLTEIGIASTVLGPDDWHNVFGTSKDYDESMAKSYASLREAQQELLAVHRVPVSGTDPFGKYALR